MWHMCFFKQLVQLGFFSVLCVCMRDVCVCVCVCVFLLYFVFLTLLNQPPYLTFHKKIFTTNWSQIWVLFEDLIKYILSFNTILTQFLEKWNKNYKKKTNFVSKADRSIQSMCKLGSYSVYPQCLWLRIQYKGNFTMILYGIWITRKKNSQRQWRAEAWGIGWL